MLEGGHSDPRNSVIIKMFSMLHIGGRMPTRTLPAKHPPHRHTLQVPESPAAEADTVNFSTPVSITHPARGSVGSGRGRCLAGKYLFGWKLCKGVFAGEYPSAKTSAANPGAPRQCKPNKFICIALGFFLYSAPPHMLVRLGITNKFVLLSASVYIC